MGKIILKSKNIFDSVTDAPRKGGVVIDGRKIVGVLDGEELTSYEQDGAEVLDYGDKLILPGFIDSHMHAGGNMDYVDDSYCVDVSPATTFEGVMEILQEFGRTHPDNPFILGINFNFFNLEDRTPPTAKRMDEYIPDRAVFIHTWDCHNYYTNTKALEMTGITKDTPDETNAITKDENGELTGELADTAAFVVTKVIARTFEERKGSLRNYMKKLNACGITSFADVYPTAEDSYRLFGALEDELTTRIHFFASLMETNPEQIAEYKEKYNSPTLQYAGLKVLMDGVLTVFTAWMLKPYCNKPETCGYPAIPKEEVREKILAACEMGEAVRVHTIGDAAVKFILDVFEEGLKKYGQPKRRHNMEHIEYINPADIPRFAELGVVANMHPRHLTFYIDDAIDYLGKERERYTWVFRSILETGAIIGTGCDFPVVNFNPMLGIYAAITRARDDGYPDGGWHPEQKLTLPEILKIYTIGSAHAISREKELGTLETGKLADIVVLDRDLFAEAAKDPKSILVTKPVMTMMDGQIVYEG